MPESPKVGSMMSQLIYFVVFTAGVLLFVGIGYFVFASKRRD